MVRIIADNPHFRQRCVEREIDCDCQTSEFFDGAYIVPQANGRYAVTGDLCGRVATIIVKRLGTEAIVCITIRPANKKERAHYAKQTC